MVTTSPDRVRNMIDIVNEITGGRGSNFFLFVDRPTLTEHDPLSAAWTSGKGALVGLTD